MKHIILFKDLINETKPEIIKFITLIKFDEAENFRKYSNDKIQ